MRRSPLLWTLSLASLVTACGATPSAGDSGLQTIFDANDIAFMKQDEVKTDPNASAMGTLVNLVAVDDEVFATPFCSAFKISPRHILSAAHCYQEGDLTGFDMNYVAADEDVQNFHFAALGKLVRLVFDGLPIAPYLNRTWTKADALPTPAYIDRVHDFVVWELPADTEGAGIAWNHLSQEATALAAFGYPQGSPLAKADHCSGLWHDGVLRHDCDTLTGNSGGLVINAAGQPVALHTNAAGDNLWAIYKAQGKFESLDDMQAKLEAAAPSLAAQAWECAATDTACIVSGGRNRALGLSWIKKAIEQKSPELAARIKSSSKAEKESRCPNAHAS